MFDINDLYSENPFSMDMSQKDSFYNVAMRDLACHHYNHCKEYKRILDVLGFDIHSNLDRHDIPFIPVRMFKEYGLLSVPQEDVVKTMTSSGTSGQRVSKIFLDRATSSAQTKVLTKISSDFLGNKRLPMLVIDSPSVVKDRNLFSARGAGILGFSMLGRDVTYALDENMQLNVPVIEEFLSKHKEENIFLFGFTFMIWQYFYKAIKQNGCSFDLSRGIMLHGGGFKKLIEEAVSNEEFKQRLCDAVGIKKVFNYYGMVEQTGSIFIECEYGHLHCSNFSDIIIRRTSDFSECAIGEKGLIQLQSLIPTSYPGFNILSEDEGAITSIDTCPCGRKGKTFKIFGRIKSAEVRGCSDTYERK